MTVAVRLAGVGVRKIAIAGKPDCYGVRGVCARLAPCRSALARDGGVSIGALVNE
ncbi:hypothetical protein ACIPO9_11775 [Pseudomonas sp. NPDC090203]|uniref:hypothetical protein n=1 Tax=Pseudomonas sp. NPDC090203 TaxID=3364477 RepID=UPI0037FBDA6F